MQTSSLLIMHLVVLALTIAPCTAPAGENWTSFQNGGRVQLTDTTPADHWTKRWSVEIAGVGQSSPVVWGETVYVTSVSGPQKETYHVTAYGLAHGTKRWQYDLSDASPQESTNYVSLAAPTSVADEHGIVAFFEGGNLVALTHEGELRWERNLVAEYGPIDSRHGLGSSLAQSSDAAFVWVERETEPYVLAVNKASGETIWKVAGAGATSWASPRLLAVEGGEHLVLSAVGILIGLDPATGERLWTLDGISGNSTPTPMPFANGRFLIGATTGREGGEASSAESNGAVGVERSADGAWQAAFLWRAKRATSSFGSPIAFDGLAYYVNRAGVLYGLDLSTGEERFAERIGGSIWATPVAVGDQLLFPRKDGVIATIASGPKFKLLSEIPAGEESAAKPPAGSDAPASGPTLYAAVVVGDRLLARFGDRLTCFESKAQ